MGTAHLKFKARPILLKRLLRDLGMTQENLKDIMPLGKQTLHAILNRAGYFPQSKKSAQARQAIENFIRGNDHIMSWLGSNGFQPENIWDEDETPGERIYPKRVSLLSPAQAVILSPAQAVISTGGRNLKGTIPRFTRNDKKIGEPSDRGNQQLSINNYQSASDLTINWEVEMLTPEAKKIFKLFKDPFIDDIQSETDLYMSDEHRYIEAAMLDAARHSGFLAVVGDVGSGKSTIRKKVFIQLKRDNNVLIISPRCIDKSQLTASSICDAVIRDISSENPKNRLEDKARQVTRLLTERSDSSQRHCLFIEEAHDLSTPMLKYLKRFLELEDGFRRLMGIILVGQLEMKRKLDERSNFDVREVIRRCQIVELGPLDGAGDLEKYLSLKFKRAGIEIASIFQDDAYPALRERMTVTNGKSKVSHLYPLLINNYTAKALNLAAQLGQKKVTAEVVYEV